ncbi:MAG: hypothetical protein CVU55_06200 [Deltaproteobacteria bacterium HGW-Deltaproteobacteria-13]|jgi:hypothetical protein|nr:MAG: hypothetical protein CVU55_06200 [Deltaproteobacteria bacterium HGW-Deltaproteobacteria-13]
MDKDFLFVPWSIGNDVLHVKEISATKSPGLCLSLWKYPGLIILVIADNLIFFPDASMRYAYP